MSDSLSEYGKSFQIKVLSSLLSDKLYLKQISDILYPKYFDGESLQWIFTVIMDYFIQYKTIPTLDVFKSKTVELKDDVLKTSIVESLKDVWRYLSSDDLEYVKNETKAFCQDQRLKEAILKSVDLLKEKKYENIRKEIDDALKSGSDREVGHEYKIDIDARYVENLRQTIETPWAVIDSLLDGGLGKKELYIIMALAGGGKSTLCMNIGAHCLKKGLRVVHYTMELDDVYTGLRYDSILTGIPSQELKFNKEQVKKILETVSGELIIKFYPEKTASSLTLRGHLDKLIMQDRKPDLVIVDYADLLKGVQGRKDLRIEIGDIYSDLRSMAQEYDIPVITPTQVGRSAANDDAIKGESVAEAYSKIMIADFIMSLSRKTTDKIAGTGRVHIVKNRFGSDGNTFPSRLNMANGRIEVFDEDSNHGKQVTSDMNEDNITRNHLKKKYEELKTETSKDWLG